MHRAENDIRVLVVADDQLARAGLAALIADQPGCTVVGQMAGPEFSTTTPDLYSPDAVVWELGWDSTLSLELLDRAQEAGLPTVVLAREEQAAAVRYAGALGVLSRDVAGPTLATALMAASHGLAVLDPALTPSAWLGHADGHGRRPRPRT